MEPSRLYAVGIILVVAGAAVAALGSMGSGSTSFGGVVFLGPIPIVFGSGPDSGLVALTALVISAVIVVTILLSVLVRGRARRES